MSYQSLAQYLGANANHGDDVAYVTRTAGYRSARFRYRDLAQLSVQVARELNDRSIQKGDRVLIWGRNSAEWVGAFFGCILSGVIAVPIDQLATEDFVERVARQVGAKLLIAAEAHAHASSSSSVLNLDTLADAVKRHSSEPYVSPELSRSTPAQIIFTSGTTAEPKGVVITHGNILANIEPLETAIRPYLKWERIVHPLRFLDLVPLSHVFGQFMGVWIPPLLGASVIFQDSLNPAEIMSTTKRERASVIVAVPRVLQALQNKIERDFEAAGKLAEFRADFAAAANEKILRRMWRFREIHRHFGWKFWALISGGATLNPETETFWGRIGFAAIQGYGLTETTSLVTVNHPFRLGRGSIGQVLGGRELKLDPSGEILVRGESVSSGYWQGTKDTENIGQQPSRQISQQISREIEDGWFHTGDLGAVDAQGNVYFKGRKKDVIVTPAGMNVYPQDVEAALRRQPAIKDCVVFGLATGGNSEPAAVLLLNGKSEAGHSSDGSETQNTGNNLAEEAVDHANAALAEYQRIQKWLVWPEPDFPRTSTGKPKTAEIRATAEAQFVAMRSADAPRLEQFAARSEASGGITDLIRRIGDVRGTGRIDSEMSLNNLNLSSLDRVELLGAIEDRYQVDLNETNFTRASTVGELERMVREAAPGRSDFVFPTWSQRWPITWVRGFCYYALTWPVTHLLAHPRVSGRENLRAVKGPVLVICNHVLYLDVGFVLAVLPARLRSRLAVAMGGERLAEMRCPPREWFFLRRWLHRMNYFLVVSLFNVFPLPKTSGFRESFRFAGDLVDRGWSVLIFPEGGQTPDGTVQPFRGGIGILANNLKIPVVPMRIEGAYEIREAHRLFNRPGRIRVHIGKPVEFPAASDPQQITRVLEERVAALGEAAKP